LPNSNIAHNFNLMKKAVCSQLLQFDSCFSVQAKFCQARTRVVQAAAPAQEPRGFYDDSIELLRIASALKDNNLRRIVLSLRLHHERVSGNSVVHHSALDTPPAAVVGFDSQVAAIMMTAAALDSRQA